MKIKEEVLQILEKTEADEIAEILNKNGKEKLNYWKFIKRIKRKDSEEVESMEDENKVITKEREKILKIKINYYERLYEKKERDEDKDKRYREEIEKATKDEEENKKEYNKEFDIEELEQAIREIKLNKATGPDEISNEMIKHGDKLLKKSILKIFNEVMNNERECPMDWKIGDIISIYKGKGNKNKMEFQRGITLTSCILKTLEKMINNIHTQK